MNKRLSVIIVLILLCSISFSIQPIKSAKNQNNEKIEENRFFSSLERIFSFFKTIFQRITNHHFELNQNQEQEINVDSNQYQPRPLDGSVIPIEINKDDHLSTDEYVEVGDNIHYNITIKNPLQNGMQHQVHVIDFLPENVSFIQSESPGWSYDTEDHFAFRIFEQLAANETQNMNLTVQVDQGSAPIMLNNTVKVNSSALDFNQTFERTAVGPGLFDPVEVIKTDNRHQQIPPATAQNSQFINYTITVHNQNLLDVHNITIRDKLSENVTFIQASHNGNPEDIDDNTFVFWGFEILESKQNITVWLNVSLSPEVDPGVWIRNNVSVNCSETNNGGNDTEKTLVIEGLPPETTIETGQPNHEKPAGPYVTLNTPIYLNATDPGDPENPTDPPYWTGVKNITYEITWYNEQNNPMYLGKNVVTDNSDQDNNPEKGIIDFTFSFDEPCKHKLSFWATDESGNIEQTKTQMFYVDEQPPGLSAIFNGPHEDYFYYHAGDWYTGIARDTTIHLQATGTGSNNDFGCHGGAGFQYLTYRWYAGESIEDLVKINDENLLYPTVELDLFMNLWHRIEYHTSDILGNNNPGQVSHKSIHLIIDEEGPSTSFNFDGPHYIDEDDQDWINSHSNMIISAEDTGRTPVGSGVQRIEWHVDKKINDEWTTVKQGIVYDNDLNDTDGTPANPESGNAGGLYAFDYKGEPYIFKDLNGNWKYDKHEDSDDTMDPEPIIDDDPDRDGHIEENIADPLTGDNGGLWAMDAKNEPYLFKDDDFNDESDETDGNWQYDLGEPVFHFDPDEDSMMYGSEIPKYVASPQPGQLGGYFGFDADDEPYTFQDTFSDKNQWQYDRYWQDEAWHAEPIVCLKPDYDGAGRITMDVAIDEDGRHRLYYQPFDTFNNPGLEHNRLVLVDNTAPETSIETGIPSCVECYPDFCVTCVTKDTKISLHTSDMFSEHNVGVDHIHYELNGNPVDTQSTDPFFYFNSIQEYNVTWYAVDKLGNVEIEHQKIYYVDETPPDITIDVKQPHVNVTEDGQEPDYWINASTDVILEVMPYGLCKDFNAKFRLNQGTWHQLTDNEAINGINIDPFLTDEIRYELEFRVHDCLHGTVYKSMVLYVDNTGPTFSVWNPQDGGIYQDGDRINCLVYAEDDPQDPYTIPSVGIQQGLYGSGVLLDVFPGFHHIELENIDFRYDPDDDGSTFFRGEFEIPQPSGLSDGAAILVIAAKDRLGNWRNTIIDQLQDYYEQADGDQDLFEYLVNNDGQLADDIVWVQIDNDQPEEDHGTVDSASIITPSDNSMNTNGLLNIQVTTTGDAAVEDITVKVSIARESYPTILKTATYNAVSDSYSINDYDVSYLENDSTVTLHAIADTPYQSSPVESEDVSLTIRNSVYFSTALTSGWNTIEFDELKGDNKVESVFEHIIDDVEVIFEEDADGTTGKYFIPNQEFNTLHQVMVNKTYKIKMDNDAPLYIEK